MRKVTENEKMVFEFIKDRIEEVAPPSAGVMLTVLVDAL